eukprot:m.1383 g.1383  ORF g.1383 m.1383 type:complete len:53 (+) comp6351_c0_seq1:217-375(+)
MEETCPNDMMVETMPFSLKSESDPSFVEETLKLSTCVYLAKLWTRVEAVLWS